MSGSLGDGWGSGWDSGSSGDSFDWSSLVGDNFSTNNQDTTNWWDSIGGGLDAADSGSGGGTFSNWLKTIGGIMGGGEGGAGGSIWEGLLAGLGGAAESFITKDVVEEQGKQQRKTLDFEAGLKDYYNQKDKVRKRAALDTYGQFSLMDRFAPNATAAPGVDMPNKPGY